MTPTPKEDKASARAFWKSWSAAIEKDCRPRSLALDVTVFPGCTIAKLELTVTSKPRGRRQMNKNTAKVRERCELPVCARARGECASLGVAGHAFHRHVCERAGRQCAPPFSMAGAARDRCRGGQGRAGEQGFSSKYSSLCSDLGSRRDRKQQGRLETIVDDKDEAAVPPLSFSLFRCQQQQQ